MKEEVLQAIEDLKRELPGNREDLEAFRIKYLGKRGIIQNFFTRFKEVSPEERKELGKLLNDFKRLAQDSVSSLMEHLHSQGDKAFLSDTDLTRPVQLTTYGARHPLSVALHDIINIFTRLGYTKSEGPEIEDDLHNFSYLNFPEDHPARDMQDTFFIEKDPDVLLRTHTSSVQVRVMQQNKPPIRTISPGRVFRNEAISARSHCIFHQVEGLYIDTGISFAHMKHDLLFFAQEMFGKNSTIRLRPSYFPFTEPSAEMDVSCNICGGKGCNICKYTGWLEVMGCGMVDPNVLEKCNIDPETYSGFAFGMGIERTTMLRYNIKDIRLFFENDLRFLQQFEAL